MEQVSQQELAARWSMVRSLLRKWMPDTGGIIVFSRINIYYLTGTFGTGLLWLPLEGDPVYLCRRGIERARIESPLGKIFQYYSYKDVEAAVRNAGAPLSEIVAIEMNSLSWALANSFTKYLPNRKFVPGDKIMAMARAVKSEWELSKLRAAGAKHCKCLVDLLPGFLKNGVTELEVSHRIMELYFAEGHHGILRVEGHGVELFLGHIAIGDSGNYPSFFDGPVGLRGVHPATPHMGSADIAWRPGLPLIVDNGFNIEGYQTDKTQVYWLGPEKSIPAPVRAAHDFCIRTQTLVAEQLKPGALPSDIWAHCIESAEEEGFAEGFMGLGGNKVSFAGHGIGLAIDEYPVLAKGFDLPLEQGMVLAVEPKIGIRGVGMVGVENTFEVTTSGGKCLTGDSYDIICVEE